MIDRGPEDHRSSFPSIIQLFDIAWKSLRLIVHKEVIDIGRVLEDPLSIHCTQLIMDFVSYKLGKVIFAGRGLAWAVNS